MSVYTINDVTTVVLGISELRRTLVNQAADIVEFTAAGRGIAESDLYAYDTAVTIKKDSVNWFKGKLLQPPHTGTGTAQDAVYRVAGPWAELERLGFQQIWKMWDTDTSALTNQYKGRVILGHSIGGARLNVGEQIAEIITYAALCGVSIAAGSISIPVDFPWQDENDITCAAAIQTVLKWVPDAVVYIDYAPETPTLNVVRRGSLSSVTIDFDDLDSDSVDLTARNDLSTPAVIIAYEQNHHVDSGDDEGYDYQTVSLDKYPVDATGREIGAIVATLQLAGSSLSKQSQDIEVEALPAELNVGTLDPVADVAFWKTKIDWLNDDNISNIEINGMERYGITVGETTSYYPNILVKGSIHDWMTDNVGYDSMEILISYNVARVTDTGSITEQIINEPYIFKFVATDLETDTYRRLLSYASGEAIPSGLAEALYNAANTLHYDGSLTIVEAAPPD